MGRFKAKGSDLLLLPLRYGFDGVESLGGGDGIGLDLGQSASPGLPIRGGRLAES